MKPTDPCAGRGVGVRVGAGGGGGVRQAVAALSHRQGGQADAGPPHRGADPAVRWAWSDGDLSRRQGVQVGVLLHRPLVWVTGVRLSLSSNSHRHQSS